MSLKCYKPSPMNKKSTNLAQKRISAFRKHVCLQCLLLKIKLGRKMVALQFREILAEKTVFDHFDGIQPKKGRPF